MDLALKLHAQTIVEQMIEQLQDSWAAALQENHLAEVEQIASRMAILQGWLNDGGQVPLLIELPGLMVLQDPLTQVRRLLEGQIAVQHAATFQDLSQQAAAPGQALARLRWAVAQGPSALRPLAWEIAARLWPLLADDDPERPVWQAVLNDLAPSPQALEDVLQARDRRSLSARLEDLLDQAQTALDASDLQAVYVDMCDLLGEAQRATSGQALLPRLQRHARRLETRLKTLRAHENAGRIQKQLVDIGQAVYLASRADLPLLLEALGRLSQQATEQGLEDGFADHIGRLIGLARQRQQALERQENQRRFREQIDKLRLDLQDAQDDSALRNLQQTIQRLILLNKQDLEAGGSVDELHLLYERASQRRTALEQSSAITGLSRRLQLARCANQRVKNRPSVLQAQARLNALRSDAAQTPGASLLLAQIEAALAENTRQLETLKQAHERKLIIQQRRAARYLARSPSGLDRAIDWLTRARAQANLRLKDDWLVCELDIEIQALKAALRARTDFADHPLPAQAQAHSATAAGKNGHLPEDRPSKESSAGQPQLEQSQAELYNSPHPGNEEITVISNRWLIKADLWQASSPSRQASLDNFVEQYKALMSIYRAWDPGQPRYRLAQMFNSMNRLYNAMIRDCSGLDSEPQAEIQNIYNILMQCREEIEQKPIQPASATAGAKNGGERND